MMIRSSKPLGTSFAVLSGSAAVAYASCWLYARRNEKKKVVALSNPMSKNNVTDVSHIHLEVEDIQKSKKFYVDLGFLIEEEHYETRKRVLMKVPGLGGDQRLQQPQPYLLIEEKNISPVQRIGGDASAVGYARMCLLVASCERECIRLSALGYKSVAPTVTDRPGNPKDKNQPVSIIAYSDPDGNMVELVSITGNVPGTVTFPVWVHVNINITSYSRSWTAYQKLGFVMGIDYGRVENKLYKALGIADPGIAKQVSLINLPNTRFMIDLIEWENPKTVRTEMVASTLRLALTVDDIALKLDELLHSEKRLWSLGSTLACEEFPISRKSTVRCTVKDPDGVPVDLVSFPESILVKENYEVLQEIKQEEEERTVLVTGCDSGLGRSLAIHMAGLGFSVIAACYTEDGALFLESIATTVVADLTTDEGLKVVVDVVHSKANESPKAGLWAIVNNAGMHMPGHVEWVPPEAYKTVMALNFHAPVYLIHELTPLLRRSRGRIVNVTSVCGIVSAPSNSTYSSSKFALEALSDSLRVENKAFGVDVVVVQPTTMRTKLGTSWYKSWAANYESANPNKTAMHPSDWAKSFVKTGSGALDAAAEDPRVTVIEMVNALVMKNPPPRILSGVGALWYQKVSNSPESIRDDIFQIGPDPNKVVESA